MKSFTAKVYSKRSQRTERVTVFWKYSPIINKAQIVEIRGKSGDITRHVPNYQLENLEAEINRQALNLNHEQRIEMMWSSCGSKKVRNL